MSIWVRHHQRIQCAIGSRTVLHCWLLLGLRSNRQSMHELHNSHVRIIAQCTLIACLYNCSQLLQLNSSLHVTGSKSSTSTFFMNNQSKFKTQQLNMMIIKTNTAKTVNMLLYNTLWHLKVYGNQC